MLEAILSFITNQFEELGRSQSMNALLLRRHLAEISRLIHIAQASYQNINDAKFDGDDFIKALHDILKYIEIIPVETTHFYGNSRTALGKLLADDTKRYHTILKIFPSYGTKVPAISEKEQYIIGSIHVSLMEYCEKLWSFHYLSNNEGDISNLAIRQWQQQMQQINSSLNAYKDFKRSFTIRNTTNNDNIAIAQSIEMLVNDADSYLDEDKDLLKKWIKANGGQDINRLVDSLISNYHFMPRESVEDVPNVGCSTGHHQNWTLEDGLLCFNYVVDIGQITLGLAKGIMADTTGNIRELCGNSSMINDGSGDELEAALLKYRGKVRPTVLRITVKIQLEVVEKNDALKVLPVIKKLNVLSFTQALHRPPSSVLDNNQYKPLNWMASSSSSKKFALRRSEALRDSREKDHKNGLKISAM